jgi:hypothetical protein
VDRQHLTGPDGPAPRTVVAHRAHRTGPVQPRPTRKTLRRPTPNSTRSLRGQLLVDSRAEPQLPPVTTRDRRRPGGRVATEDQKPADPPMERFSALHAGRVSGARVILGASSVRSCRRRAGCNTNASSGESPAHPLLIEAGPNHPECRRTGIPPPDPVDQARQREPRAAPMARAASRGCGSTTTGTPTWPVAPSPNAHRVSLC